MRLAKGWSAFDRNSSKSSEMRPMAGESSRAP